MTRFTALLLALPLAFGATAVEAAVLTVPGDAKDLQGAVAIAKPGDTIEVGAGRWCGALIDKPLNLVGRGDAVIVGAKDDATCNGPALNGGTYRVGFHLLSAAASGTTIRHFEFDGSRAATDSSALAYAVYASGGKVNGVQIEHNKVRGTLDAFSNQGGDDWVVRHNDIRGLTTRGGVGGRGIVVAQSGASRPQRASVTHNRIETDVPNAAGSGPWYAGVYVAGADWTTVTQNRFEMDRGGDDHAAAGGATPAVYGVGVVVTHGVGPNQPARPLPGAGGFPLVKAPLTKTPEQGSQNTTVTMNDGKKCDYVVVVTGPVPAKNTFRLLQGNLGTTLLEGQASTSDGRGDMAARHRKGHGAGEDD